MDVSEGRTAFEQFELSKGRTTVLQVGLSKGRAAIVSTTPEVELSKRVGMLVQAGASRARNSSRVTIALLSFVARRVDVERTGLK